MNLNIKQILGNDNKAFIKSDENGKLVADKFLSQELTKAELIALTSTSGLVVSNTYVITDSYHGGKIYLRALTENRLDFNGVWEKSHTYPAFGSIALTAGSSGSVSAINVNGVNQMTSTVNYTTSLANTTILIANNINANGSATFRAVPCDQGIVLVSKTNGTAYNGLTVAGTATNITLGGIRNTQHGLDGTTKVMDVKYDISIDRLYYCYDKQYKNTMDYVMSVGDTRDVYSEFRWTNSYWANNKISSYSYDYYTWGNQFMYFFGNNIQSNTVIRNVFFASPNNAAAAGGFLYNNFINYNTGATNGIQKVFMSTTSTNGSAIGYTVYGYNAYIRNITMVTTGQTGIDQSQLIGGSCGIDGVRCFGGISTIRGVSMIGSTNVISNIQINTGVLSLFRVAMNNVGGTITNITSNGTQLGFNRVVLNGADCTVTDITLTGASNVTFTYVNLNAPLGVISNIAFNANTATSLNFSNITINSANSQITNINYNNIPSSIFRNITINSAGFILNGITFDSTLTTIENIEVSNNEYSITYTSPIFNNTANRGLVNSPITLGYIMPKIIPYDAFIEYTSLTSSTSTAQVKIGIETDNDSNIVSPTVITSVANSMQQYSPVFVKPSVVRKIILTPTVEGLTGGQLRISLKSKIGL